MKAGLYAYPLTPFAGNGIDYQALDGLMARLTEAGVDGIGALGSTGCAPYLEVDQRLAISERVIAQAGQVPVMVGISALATRDVLRLAEGAQRQGAASLLLAPVSYQPLNEDEVFGLYQSLSAACDLPLCVYENPRTTHFTFSDALRQALAQLPRVAAFKLPGLTPADNRRLRALLPPHINLGVAGDGAAAEALGSGVTSWHSVAAGLFPDACRALYQAAKAQKQQRTLAPLWALFTRFGSLKVMAASAALLGLASHTLPQPLQPLGPEAVREVKEVLVTLGLLGI